MTRKTSYILLGAAAAVALLLITSCSTAKKSSKGEAYQAGNADAAKQGSVESEYRALAQSYTPWQDVTVPLKVQVMQPSKLSASATAKMIYDKSVSVSVRFLGLEVASLYADNDEIILVSKFNGMYCQESMATFTSTFGLSLADLQALVLGQVFSPGSGRLGDDGRKKFDIELGTEAMTLTPKKMQKGLTWTFATSLSGSSEPSLRSLIVSAAGHEPIVAAYGTAQSSAAGNVAPWVNISTTIDRRTVDATLTWSLEKAKWNTGVSLSKPKIPSGARRVTAVQLMEMLKK